MKVLAAILAVFWLIIAGTATVHAEPNKGQQGLAKPCHVEATITHHGDASHRDDTTAMPCCSQPAVVAMPAETWLPVRIAGPQSRPSTPNYDLPGVTPAAIPHPPKPILSA